ncbi:ependymin-like isoform X1 [Sphaeramia orbicularis]|uniref:Ependymin-like n=1 Tax=Sphaeramia orbicularis TaxID=375764 RepID=A0A673ABT7_9TELE|nr:ependymin-like isoform X1 [Sphaeramia orbicularis]XP_030018321.1 ependymin-like isoform X1 [Sphaeramia orbicularis]XP_030018322.1 ependymin-like isoform X1 [Sphaeramia orbicularis]XP_030018324.1 ependymin-like isoform X1 [Sphaeramia orbicularis]XP_030018325.1 ependymin-like isoform X1 [Sphaeramia orbicularis]XP_030018326.1 ependymin-like isoform X1 [Sphaeramia orbicularis]
MRLLAVLTCLLACCLAQKPKPCESPPLLSGAFTVSTQNEKVWTYGKYVYDALGKRMRLFELGIYENKTFNYDAILLYREGVMYEIHDHDKTCEKKPLKADFFVLGVPKNSSFVGQAVVGTSSAPGAGLLVNTWTGEMPELGGKYMTTVTEYGCIPVNYLFHTADYGWMVINYFDNVVGITDPGVFIPPDFCKAAMMKPQSQPVDIFSLFHNKH